MSTTQECERFRTLLPKYAREELGKENIRKVEEHLATCRACVSAIVSNRNLSSIRILKFLPVPGKTPEVLAREIIQKGFIIKVDSLGDKWLSSLARDKRSNTPEKLVDVLQRQINTLAVDLEAGRMTSKEEADARTFQQNCQRLLKQVKAIFKI
jgi:hypothetical protein